MKKVIFASLALISLVSLSSCKTKQSAYRKAYEQAKQREVATQDANPTAQYEAPAASTAAPVTVRKERVSTYSGEDATRLKRFRTPRMHVVSRNVWRGRAIMPS